MAQPPRLNLSILALMMVLATVSCVSEVPENQNLPPKVTEITKDDAPVDAQVNQEKWEAFAAYLGIGNNTATSQIELISQLGTPSTLLSEDKASEYTELVTSISQNYGASAYKTRCAEIDSIVLLASAKQVDTTTGETVDLETAKVYLMKYKLQSDASGESESQTRSGLLVIPVSGSASAPLVAYAHGGDFGLGYGEIAAAFGAFQGNHIIIAPTFPGEPLCKTKTDTETQSCDTDGILATAVGTGKPYDNDVDELLGMYDCVSRAALQKLDGNITDATGTATGATLTSTIAPLVKRHAGTGALAQVPQGILVGSSRGGLVVDLALAKTGAALQALATGATDPLGPAYFLPSYFSCAASISAPKAFTMGKLRLLLEHWVKGTLEYTPFKDFPGVEAIEDLFDDYRSGNVDVGEAALAIAKRDGILTGPLIIAALRNWTGFAVGTANGGQGASLFMHGTHDAVAPFTQTQVGYNILLGLSANAAIVNPTDPSKSPGIAMTFRGFRPDDKFLEGGKLKSKYLQHGDAAFFNATAIIPGDFFSPLITGTTLSNATAEAGAVSYAQNLFGESYDDADLVVARGYVLSGILQMATLPETETTSDAAGNTIINLHETSSPAEVFAAWRTVKCEAALTGS